MRKQLLTKMLLIAASLFMGTSAWAVTKMLYPTGTTDPTNPSVWTLGYVTGTQNAGYISFTHSGNGCRNLYLKFFNTGSDFYSDYDSYTVSFDFWNNNAWSNSYSSIAEIMFFAEDAGFPSPLYSAFTGANTTKKNYLLGLEGSGTWINSFKLNGSETSVTFTKQTWYTASITVTNTGSVTYSICPQGSSTPITNGSGVYTATSDGTSYKCQGILLTMGRGCYETRVANVKVTTEVDEEVISDPTIAITAVSGANRTVTITGGTSSDGTATVTTYYTTDGSDPTSSSSVYSSSLTITENCTVKAISISDKGGESNISSLAVTTGAITLNAPTYTKTAYSAGVSTITLSCDQSDKTLSPTATIHWSAGARSGDVASGTSVNVNDGETLEAYCVADGYTNSSTLSVTATPYVGATVWTESYTGTDGGKITLGDEIETGLYKMLASEGTITVSEYLLTANSNINNYFLLRNSTAPGIYSGNGRTYAITGLTAGQHVVVTTNNGSETATVTAGANLMKDTWETWPAHFAFNVTADGTAKFSINRYCSVASVTVYSSAVSATLGTNGYATFASTYPLDLTTENLPAGVKAYKASVSGKTVTFTELNQTVPANTGILIEGTGTSVDIPVAASGTAVTGNAFEVNTTGATFSGDGDYYYFGLVKNTLTFRKFTPSSVAIPANKAYLKVLKSSVDAGARELNVVFEDEATGISAIPMNSEVMNNNYFDLQGRRVAQPTKGMYIVNGKKIIIK